MESPDPTPLRVAVVGTGGWGEQHARIFARRPDTDLVGVLGRDRGRADHRAAAYDTRAYTDVAELYAREQPDLVTVCLPNEGHFEPTLDLIDRGVPLLVEKPLVFELDEADALLAAAAERDLFFGINFNHRFAEAVQRAKRRLDQGDLGRLQFVGWRFGGEPNFGTSPHANLIETQCHGFDMLEYLAGPIESVSAEMTDLTLPGTYTTVALALRFESGAVGTMLGTYDSSYAYPHTQVIEVNGDDGRLLIDDTVKRVTFQRPGDETREVWEPGYFNDEARTFAFTFDRHVDAILDALRAGTAPPVPAEFGRRALQLAHACVRSFETGQRVRVSDI